MNVNDITITSLETITAFEIGTGSHLFTLDELQNATLSQTQDKVDITGKQGRKLNSLKRNKAVKVSGSNGMVSGGLFEMQTGGTFENKATDVMWKDYLTVQSGEATTSYKAIGTVGNEIDTVYVKNSDGTIASTLEQDSTAADGKFAYDPAAKKLTFHTNISNGTEIVVFYTRKILSNTLDNKSDVFSKKCMLYIDALGEDKCNNVYHLQFYIPRADFNGEFSFEMGDNQTVHSFEAEALAGACGSAGTLWTYTIFGADAEDVA